MDIQTLAARLEALGNESRLNIFRTLVRAGPEGLAVGEVQARTGIARSTLSHHLHKLIGVGLISQRRERTTLYCVVCFEVLDDTLGFFQAECCADQGIQEESAA